MALRIESLATAIESQFGAGLKRVVSSCDELTYEVAAADLLSVCATLRDGAGFKFEQLIELTGMDYLSYGEAEWSTQESTNTGFSRGVSRGDTVKVEPRTARFAVVYHLLSLAQNLRLRL